MSPFHIATPPTLPTPLIIGLTLLKNAGVLRLLFKVIPNYSIKRLILTEIIQ